MRHDLYSWLRCDETGRFLPGDFFDEGFEWHDPLFEEAGHFEGIRNFEPDEHFVALHPDAIGMCGRFTASIVSPEEMDLLMVKRAEEEERIKSDLKEHIAQVGAARNALVAELEEARREIQELQGYVERLADERDRALLAVSRYKAQEKSRREALARAERGAVTIERAEEVLLNTKVAQLAEVRDAIKHAEPTDQKVSVRFPLVSLAVEELEALGYIVDVKTTCTHVGWG